MTVENSLRQWTLKLKHEIQLFLTTPPVSQALRRLPPHCQQSLIDFVNREGRMFRSRFFYLAHRTLQEKDSLIIPEVDLLQIGLALELFQNFLLIHDDIADDAHERRGGPALNRVMSVGDALVLGDILFILSLWPLQNLSLSHQKVISIQKLFLETALWTGIGQLLDQSNGSVTPEQVSEMYDLKTGTYSLKLPLKLAALLHDAAPALDVFDRAGQRLGLAYQLIDDLENISPKRDEPDPLRKDAGGDYSQQKATLLKVKLEERLGRAWDFELPVERFYHSLRTTGVWAKMIADTQLLIDNTQTEFLSEFGERSPLGEMIQSYWSNRLEQLK